MSITYTVDVELGLEDSTGPVVDNLEISGASCPRESLALDVVDKHGVERGTVGFILTEDIGTVTLMVEVVSVKVRVMRIAVTMAITFMRKSIRNQ